ncbi:pectinesterase family protein [Niabella pedocola]|uniref:Pectinesterase n=1 Tax=Niabella pedocola TaxID=1752077 RepID=A0ABS8PUK2_9BACT|nr:pectinesterase family protein [Niabella pedocola]MCD2424755.1 pectinesterase family protein [Niabella pedocola]
MKKRMMPIVQSPGPGRSPDLTTIFTDRLPNKVCMKVIVIIFLLFAYTAIPARGQTANPEKYQYVFTVAQDGSGNFTKIQDAIRAMRGYPLAPITLYIRNGVYNEKIELPANNTDVTFIGESVDSTIITYADYSGKGSLTTFTSYTAKISGNRFIAENITFVNAAGPVGQALALYVDADQALFKNCRFIGNQDTIFNGGETARQFFWNCYIEGTTDFIFGPATALYSHCIIKAKANSYITAASTTKGKAFGLVFTHCRILAEPGVKKLFLGRPWRAYAKTVFIHCEMPAAIAPEGWHNWSNPDNEKTVYYGEYGSQGPGSSASKRVSWARNIGAVAATLYTPEQVFATCSPQLPAATTWYKNIQPAAFKWPVK